MGTIGKDGSNPLIFDGRPESWPLFKKALHQLLDKEGYGWVVDGGDVFCGMLQAASAKAAKSTVTSGKVTVSTNVADYQKKDLQSAFTNASVTTSVLKMSLAHALQANHLRCLLSSCVLQIKYACVMIETGTRHTILICACTNPEEVAGILRTFHLSLLISNVKHVLLHLARAPIVK
jgi:hypothetical protein